MSRLPSVGCGPLGDELADPTHPPAGRVGVVAEFLCHPAGAAAGGGGQHDGVTAEDGGDGRGVVLPAVGGLMSTVAVPLISQLNRRVTLQPGGNLTAGRCRSGRW